jgi:predicted PurR-regulated permease PerM
VPSEMPPPRAPERIALDMAIRLALLGCIAWVAWTLIRPFVPVLLWSAVLTVAFYPAFEWLRARFGGRSLPAALCLTIVALAVTAGPVMLLTTSLVHSLVSVGDRIGSLPHHLPPLPDRVAELPGIGPQIAHVWATASANLEPLLERYAHLLIGPGRWALDAAASLADGMLAIFVAIVVSGFLYAPAPRLDSELRVLARQVIGTHGEDFVHLAAITIRTVARGVIGVASIQATLIGVALITAAVPAAGLLTLAALLLCIVQVGALPIVIPILVWAWLTRDTGPALILTLWLIPVALSDNLLKPLMMSKGLTTPIFVILIGVVGGSLAYGLTGLFVGPVVLAAFYELVRFWLADSADRSA